MNGKKGLSRIMSALLAASSMIGGADVSARSDRKREVAVAANGVSRKLSSGSNLYKYLAIGCGSALGGGLLTVAGIRFFGGSQKGGSQKEIKKFVSVSGLDNNLVADFVEDIGDFLLVFNNSKITFEVEEAPNKKADVSGTVTLALDFTIYDGVKDWMAGKFLAERKGMKMYIDWSKQSGGTLAFGVRYCAPEEPDECDYKVGCALNGGLPVFLNDGQLPEFDVKFIDEDKVLGGFVRRLVRTRLLFLYLRDKRNHNTEEIGSDRLAKICNDVSVRGVEVEGLDQSEFENLTKFKLGD